MSDSPRYQDSPLARSESIAGFDRLVVALGGDPIRLYHKVGLSPELFQEADNMVPWRAVVRMLNLASSELNCEDFGLRLADNRKALPLGILGLLMAHSPDVGTAIRNVCDHYEVVHQSVGWKLEENGKYATLTRWDRISGNVPTFQSGSMGLGNCLRALRHVSASNWRPETVHFSHTAPTCGRAFRRYFGVEVAFDQEWTGFLFPASDLKRPISNRDAEVWDLLLHRVQELEQERPVDMDFVSKIRMLIRQSIHTNHCTQEALAHLLSMHTKKFQRELQKRGLTFRQMRADIRLDVAEQLLRDSNMPLGNIALVLGFSEQSALSRAFRARHQIPHQEWRAMQTSGHG